MQAVGHASGPVAHDDVRSKTAGRRLRKVSNRYTKWAPHRMTLRNSSDYSEFSTRGLCWVARRVRPEVAGFREWTMDLRRASRQRRYPELTRLATGRFGLFGRQCLTSREP